MLVEVDADVFGNNCPDSDVELTPVKQEGVLDIFLHHPRLGLRVLVKYEFVDITKVSKELNASALIH